ncbi:MAG TPA: hypothetical protein VE954_09425 [Oligoflexus sp.]|uniref:hypothetical protein n=1 Tax=Oligoflexus sp. TaxID=1971216 RepID=UPI002D638009|nr:hypothetical protein [Oligoflexus sp.]HYX33322.1 hypothetical protein [Oligoflexus sp.]
MLSFKNILAGLTVSTFATVVAAAPAYRHVKEEVVLQNVAVEPTNGGINPDARAYIVRGQVMLGSNSCFAQGLKGKLRIENAAGGNKHVVAYVEGRQRANLICIEIFQPVYAEVTTTVRGDANLTETVFIRNVDEFGALRPLSSFTEQASNAANSCDQQAFCTREYRPTICTVNGLEIKGNNRCEALVNVRQYACLNGLNFQEEEVSCRFAGLTE